MSHKPPPVKIPAEFRKDPETEKYISDLTEAVRLLWMGNEKHVGFYGTDHVTQGAALTATVTSLTHTAPSTPDYAIADLTQDSPTAPFGFTTKDEGNTVLKVIANLQARVNELEARLDSSTGVGLIT